MGPCIPSTALVAPCNPLFAFLFLSLLRQVAVDTARVRYIGTTNRVIAGLLLFNQRSLPAACANSRFTSIAGSCKNGGRLAVLGPTPAAGTSIVTPCCLPSSPPQQWFAGLDSAPYGVDPVFKQVHNLQLMLLPFSLHSC